MPLRTAAGAHAVAVLRDLSKTSHTDLSVEERSRLLGDSPSLRISTRTVEEPSEGDRRG
jgi:hypothetical protein